MTQQECVVCTRPAYMFCDFCAELDDTGVPLPARWYCSRLCQDIDRRTHNDKCSNMVTDKELFERAERAGEVAQALFYNFIERTWAYDMNSLRIVPGSNGKLLSIEIIHGSKTAPTGQSVCKRIAGGWLFNFPHGAFGSADAKAKDALLADRHSVWAFVFMHVAVQLLFEGIKCDLICG
jgi:hypothetical protein